MLKYTKVMVSNIFKLRDSNKMRRILEILLVGRNDISDH